MNTASTIQLINKILSTGDIGVLDNCILEVDDFYSYEEEIQFIYDHYKEFGKVPDRVTMLGKFNEFQLFEVKEDFDYLIDEVKKLSVINKVSLTVSKVEKLFENGRLEDGLNLLKNLTDNNFMRVPNGITITSKEQMEIMYDHFLQKKESIPTGIEGLDKVIGGYERGEELVVFFARTGNGKSWVILKSLTEACKSGYRVGFISPEMSPLITFFRVATLDESLSFKETMTQQNVQNVKDYIKNMDESNRFFKVAVPKDFKYKITVSKLRAFVRENQIDILGIDGLKYMTDERGARSDNLAIALTNISEDLMDLSKELNIPILVAVQANRSGAMKKDEDGMPDITSIKDSDGIAHNASKVLALRQIENYFNIEIQKNRYDKSGQLLSFNWDIDVGELSIRTEVGTKTNKVNFESRFSKSSDTAPIPQKNEALNEDEDVF